MKISIFRKQKDGSESVSSEEFSDYISRIAKDNAKEYILKYRDALPYLEKADRWKYYDCIPMICPVAEYYKKKSGEVEMRAYNGISMLVVEGLNNILEVEKVKKQASVCPQVLCAVMGADAHSVSIWTLATLPDGSLPKDEKLAKLFCAQAYATSVRCVQPSLEFKISLREPSLDSRMLLTVDNSPYVNQYPTPFIFEQPTEDSIKNIIKVGDPQIILNA